MKQRDNIAVRRDDLNVMINAIENMMSSLNMLSSSLAGVLPEQILPAHLPLIAENLITCFFPDIPYYIYTNRNSDEYSADTEIAIRQLLLLIPALPSVVADSLEVEFIELRIEDEMADINTRLEMRFREEKGEEEDQGEADEMRMDEMWKKLPENFRDEFIFKLSSPDKRDCLTITTVKKMRNGDGQDRFFD
jgi:hypothetical protein